MIDDAKTLLDFLQADGPLTVLFDRRIWAEMETPPPAYKPSQGLGMCFRRRGGTQDYEAVNLFPSYQFKIYGQVGGLLSSEASANEGYRALYEALNYRATYLIKSAELEAQGQTLREPDTGWAYSLCFYRLQVLN